MKAVILLAEFLVKEATHLVAVPAQPPQQRQWWDLRQV